MSIHMKNKKEAPGKPGSFKIIFLIYLIYAILIISMRSNNKLEVILVYDVIIIGAGPGGIFSAYELLQRDKKLKIAAFDRPLSGAAPLPH